MTRQRLLQFDWEVLINPLYSPDITPSDLHSFWSLQNCFNEKNFDSLEDYTRQLELMNSLLKKIKVLER